MSKVASYELIILTTNTQKGQIYCHRMNFRGWRWKQGMMYWAMESQIPRNTEQYAQRMSGKERQHFLHGRQVWVWWKMKNNDSPSMQRTTKMNSTPTLEETFGECLKQWREHKNMNFIP